MLSSSSADNPLVLVVVCLFVLREGSGVAVRDNLLVLFAGLE